MISLSHVYKAYGSKHVLSDVSVQFPPGQVTSLIGPNGAGKTTLLMLIARLLAPTRGDLLIGGRSIADVPIRDYAKRVATLRQSPDFNLRLTVEELVAFGRFPYSRGALTAHDRQAIDEAIEFLNELISQRTLRQKFRHAVSSRLPLMLGIIRRSEEIDGHVFIAVILADPMQHFQAVHASHMEIKQDDVRRGLRIDH